MGKEKVMLGRRHFPPSYPFTCLFLLCAAGRQPVACQELPGHLTCAQSASQKPLLCSVPCQTWCSRPLVWLHVWRGSVTMQSSCWWHLWCQRDADIPLTARDFPGEMKRSSSFWGGTAQQCSWLPPPCAAWALPATSREKCSWQCACVSFFPSLMRS